MTRTLAGRYQLGEVVGRGGMSSVYRATDLMLGRTVAGTVCCYRVVQLSVASLVRCPWLARPAWPRGPTSPFPARAGVEQSLGLEADRVRGGRQNRND